MRRRIQRSEYSKEQSAFLRGKLQERRWIKLAQVVILLLFLGLWELAAYLQWVDAFIFSSPSRMLKAAIAMGKTGMLFKHIGMTLWETFVAFFLSVMIGLAVATVLWWFERVSKTLEPYIVVLNSLPKSALAPIFIVWLGNNVKAVLFTAVSVSVVVMIMNIYTGFVQVDREMLKLVRTFGGTKWQMLRKVVLPANYANIASAMKVGIGLTFIGAIIGEFLAAKAGLGYLIVYGSQVFKLDWVMMSVVLLAMMATGMYQGMKWIERKVMGL